MKGITSFTAADMALCQNPKGLHCVSPTGACHSLHNASFCRHKHHFHDSVYWIVWPKQHRGLLYLPHSTFASLTQSWQNSMPTDTEWSNILRCGMCCLKKSKRSTRCCVSFFVVGNARYGKYINSNYTSRTGRMNTRQIYGSRWPAVRQTLARTLLHGPT